MTKYKSIKQLELGETVKQVFLVSEIQDRRTKAGKPYVRMILKDKTSQIDTKIWDMDLKDYPDFKAPIFVELEIEVEEFNGSKTSKSKGLPMIVPTPKDMSLYETDLGLTPDEAEFHYHALMQYKNQVKDRYIKTYLDVVFDNPEIATLFKTAPASSTNREAFRGGLCQHIHKVMMNADAIINSQSIAKNSPKINRDIVIAGVLMHDIGKIFAYDVDVTGAKTTRSGHILQHLPMSYGHSVQAFIHAESILKKPIPEEIKDHINHIILSHHGMLEYGSPVRPASIEAQIVHVADMSDSTVTNFSEVMQANSDMCDEDGMTSGSFFTSKHMYVDKNARS